MDLKRKFLIIIVGLSLAVVLFGQNIDSLLIVMERHLNEDKSGNIISKTPQYLYGSFQFQNKSLFLGRPSDSSFMNVNAQISYYRSGFYASASGQYYGDFLSGLSSVSMTAGYTHRLFLNQLKAHLSYSYYYYPSADSSSGLLASQALSAGVKYKKKGLGAEIVYMFLPGATKGSQLTSGVYYSFGFFRNRKNFSLTIDPECMLYFGTETLTSYLGQGQYSAIEYNDVFGLLDLEIKIPLTIIWKNYDMQMSYSLHVPFTQIPDERMFVQSQFTMNFGYLFTF